MTTPDVLVVGAGPAGSLAALVLARAGVRVRVIDRARFPRPKLCGDTLNPGALAILQGVSKTLADLVRARGLPIAGMTVTGPAGAQVSADYPDGVRGTAVSRSDLDLLLIDAAVAAGAVFDEGVEARAPVLSDGRAIGVRLGAARRAETQSAPVVIAADGRGSKIAAALGLSAFAREPRRWAFGAYFTDVAGVTAHGEMHIRPDGYIGVAPLRGGTTNVCVVRSIPRGTPRASLDARQIVAHAIAAEPLLRDRFAAARQITAVTTLGPLAIDSRAAGAPGVLLAGDVAGFVDPMTGDGLRFALRGGILAAESAMSELASGRPAWRTLQAARTREFAGKWRVNRALRSLAGSPRTLAAAAFVAERWPQPVRYLIGVAGDVHLVPTARAAWDLDEKASSLTWGGDSWSTARHRSGK